MPSDKNTPVALNIRSYPMNLLVPSIKQVFSFQVINYMKKKQDFQFKIEGENLNVDVPGDLINKIELNASESREYEINLIPTIDGQGKLIISIFTAKEIQKEVEVKKLRESVPTSTINEIFMKYQLNLDEKIDNFNPNEFMIQFDQEKLRQLELHIQNKVSNGNNADNEIRELSKGYLTQRNVQKALEFALKLSNEKEKYNFYYDILQAYTYIDLEGALQIIENIKDQSKKYTLVKNISLGLVQQDPARAGQVALLIEEPTQKEKLLVNVIGRVIDLNPVLAFDISHYINNELTIAKIMINIARKYYETGNKPELVKTIRQILNIFIHSPKINLAEKKYKNPSFEFLFYILQGIAEVEGPAIVNSIIEGLPDLNLKDKIHNKIDYTIFKVVKEIQTSVEYTPLFSQFFLFNTLVSNATEDIKHFSSIGGNISNNLIIKGSSSRGAFLSLFGFPFSIFPTIDRIYSDTNKIFSYYIFPSNSGHTGNEVNVIKNTLHYFFNPRSLSNNYPVYNIDFIPYLGKPTVILSEENHKIKDKIHKVLKNSVNIVVDDSLFKGGSSLETIKQVFSPQKFNIANIVLSYEFINDYNIFKTLIGALI